MLRLELGTLKTFSFLQALFHQQLRSHRAFLDGVPEPVRGFHGPYHLPEGQRGSGRPASHPAGPHRPGNGCAVLPAETGKLRPEGFREACG